MKGDKKTAFEDCCGKPYQGEVMKFAEAAFFHFAVSPSGKLRSEARQGRGACKICLRNVAWQDLHDEDGEASPWGGATPR